MLIGPHAEPLDALLQPASARALRGHHHARQGGLVRPWEGGPADQILADAGITPEHLIQRIRRGLRHIQYRSDLIDGCLAETGLTIRPA